MADRTQRRVKQRRGFVDVVNALLTLIVLALLVVGGLVLYGAHTFYAAGPIKADTTFAVEKGNNLGTVGERLEAQGLIDNRYFFQIGGFALKKQGALKVGEYKLTAGSSMFDILRTLTEGKPLLLAVTVPEGFTVAQIIDRLKANEKLTGDITTVPSEGSILPDTYNFEPGASRQSVLDRMQQAMTGKLAEIWQNRDQVIPLDTPDQLVTLASIVEKETPVPAERAHIAGVYYNRLAKHMRLQSDPTVVYGITKGAGANGRAPTRAELDQRTPYNTYQVDGLPPGPIANPGVEALTAAAHPARNPDIYFVAVSLNPKDGHLFAATYAEHRKNVAKLRLVQKQQAQADALADADAAKDQLEEQQAASAGDPTAAAPDSGAASADAGTAAATTDQSAPPAQPAPADATTGAAATDNSAAAASTGDANAPVPMPADQRPSASTDSPAPADTTTTTPVSKSKPKPKPTTTDVFGG
ncbi:MAG: endolytic transglycosylase MltG [Devosia sp.]|nr:endolytic transglycosylase MltG [Devosia sp.]